MNLNDKNTGDGGLDTNLEETVERNRHYGGICGLEYMDESLSIIVF